jgi:hypothetical protein
MMEPNEQIEEQLEWSAEDQGIGPYEFWGTNYNDVDLTAVLETDEVGIEFPSTKEEPFEMIPTFEQGSTEVDIRGKDFQVGWKAVLVSVQILKGGRYRGVYELEQDDY